MDDQTVENFILLLNLALRRETVRARVKTDAELSRRLQCMDWPAVAECAKHTRMFPLFFEGVRACSGLASIDPELQRQWKQHAFGLALRETEQQRQAYLVVREANARGLPFLVFKGIVFAQLYPQSTQRISGDIDILINAQDRGRAADLFADLGYTLRADSSKEYVQVYVRCDPVRHVVEVHSRLWEDYAGKRIAVLESLRLDSPETSIEVAAYGTRIRTLGVTQHLVYQVFHIIKHFMLEGVGIRYAVDILLYLEAYRDMLDFPLFWEQVGRLGYTDFSRALFTLCMTYFGMDPGIVAGMPQADAQAVQVLLRDMICSGDYFNKTAKWQIMGAMTPYFTGEKEISRSRVGRVFDVVFLRPQDLTKEYAYAKRCVLLLPVAWVHRAWHYFFGWMRNRKYMYNVNEKLDVAEHRLYLMSRLGLANEKHARNYR